VDKGRALKTISEFVKALEAQKIKPHKIILLGPPGTGTQREGSDIELVVISDDFAGKDYWERIDLLAAATVRIFAPIEATAMTPQEWDSGDSLLVDRARHGEVVYGE
jgi:predicted nucleotidyltransferase